MDKKEASHNGKQQCVTSICCTGHSLSCASSCNCMVHVLILHCARPHIGGIGSGRIVHPFPHECCFSAAGKMGAALTYMRSHTAKRMQLPDIQPSGAQGIGRDGVPTKGGQLGRAGVPTRGTAEVSGARFTPEEYFYLPGARTLPRDGIGDTQAARSTPPSHRRWRRGGTSLPTTSAVPRLCGAVKRERANHAKRDSGFSSRKEKTRKGTRMGEGRGAA